MKFIKKLTQVIANFQAQIILATVYLFLVPFFVILTKIIKPQEKGWSKWQFKSDTIEDLKRQF